MLFLHRTHHHRAQYMFHLLISLTRPLVCAPWGQGPLPFSSLLRSQSPEHCLEEIRSSTRLCWMGEGMILLSITCPAWASAILTDPRSLHYKFLFSFPLFSLERFLQTRCVRLLTISSKELFPSDTMFFFSRVVLAFPVSSFLFFIVFSSLLHSPSVYACCPPFPLDPLIDLF